MKNKKSGVLVAVVAISAAVAALTTLAVLAVRFVRKKREIPEYEEVFGFSFDDDTEDNSICCEVNAAEDIAEE